MKTETGKRLILSATDKGGVGKSFTCIQLTQWIKEHPSKVKFRAFDPDHANNTLSRFHPDVTSFIDVNSPESMDQVVTALTEYDLSIVDGLGSQQKKSFGSWAEEIRLFDVADEIGFGVTFVLVIEEDSDAIMQAREAMERWRNRVDWIIVRNLKQNANVFLWNGTKAEQLAKELGAIEIVLEKLYPHLAHDCTKLGLPISELREHEKTTILDRNRLKTAWNKMSEEFKKAEKYILPSTVLV